MGAAESILTGSEERAFLGHPKGLFYLAFTEAWERFSYYGMTALLVLYMVNQALLPGHLENIAGFAGFRSAIESVVGPQSTQALASSVFGLYSGFVYFTPMLGGLIADRWIGQRNAVVIGALLMSGGHIAMAFEQSLLLALLLLVTGSGFLKGNISAQVGSLYPRDDEARRTHAFTIFSTGINIGAVLGPLVCGLLAQIYGWHYGFGAAGLFMLAGLATYLYGYGYLPARVASSDRQTGKLTACEWYTTLAVIAVIVITIFQSISQYQEFNVFPVWIQQHVAREVAGYAIPIPWYFSLESLTSIAVAPLLFLLWRWQASRRSEPGDLSKIGIGAGPRVRGSGLVVNRTARREHIGARDDAALCEWNRQRPAVVAIEIHRAGDGLRGIVVISESAFPIFGIGEVGKVIGIALIKLGVAGRQPRNHRPVRETHRPYRARVHRRTAANRPLRVKQAETSAIDESALCEDRHNQSSARGNQSQAHSRVEGDKGKAKKVGAYGLLDCQ